MPVFSWIGVTSAPTSLRRFSPLDSSPSSSLCPWCSPASISWDRGSFSDWKSWALSSAPWLPAPGSCRSWTIWECDNVSSKHTPWPWLTCRLRALSTSRSMTSVAPLGFRLRTVETSNVAFFTQNFPYILPRSGQRYWLVKFYLI